MSELSLNLEIKGIGSTTMSMADAKKLYSELKGLFEEKVKYVPTRGWEWSYPWWGYVHYNSYGTYNDTKITSGGGGRFTGNTGVSSYNISV